jgi:hypothetical protein
MCWDILPAIQGNLRLYFLFVQQGLWYHQLDPNASDLAA